MFYFGLYPNYFTSWSIIISLTSEMLSDCSAMKDVMMSVVFNNENGLKSQLEGSFDWIYVTIKLSTSKCLGGGDMWTSYTVRLKPVQCGSWVHKQWDNPNDTCFLPNYRQNQSVKRRMLYDIGIHLLRWLFNLPELANNIFFSKCLDKIMLEQNAKSAHFRTD